MSQKRRFAFTVSADKMSSDELIKQLKIGTSRWVFQKETGDGGYVHFQGRVAYKQSKRPSEVKWIQGKGKLSIESNAAGSEFYCTDPDKRLEGPWSNKTERSKYIQYRLRNPVLHKWQTEIVEEIDKQYENRNDRSMIYVHEPRGNVGKSFLMKYLFFHKKALLIPATCSSANDIVQFIASSTEDGWRGIICIDIPRSMSNKHWWLLAQALETIKTGIIYDTRYSAVTRVIEPPVLVAFSNSKPPEKIFTYDRLIFIKPKTT